MVAVLNKNSQVFKDCYYSFVNHYALNLELIELAKDLGSDVISSSEFFERLRMIRELHGVSVGVCF